MPHLDGGVLTGVGTGRGVLGHDVAGAAVGGGGKVGAHEQGVVGVPHQGRADGQRGQ